MNPSSTNLWDSSNGISTPTHFENILQVVFTFLLISILSFDKAIPIHTTGENEQNKSSADDFSLVTFADIEGVDENFYSN